MIGARQSDTSDYYIPIRQAQLKTPRWGKVPVKPATGNVMFWMLLMINAPNWRYLPLGVACHGLLWLATKHNVHAVSMFLRHILYPKLLRATGRSSPSKQKNWRFKLKWLRGG